MKYFFTSLLLLTCFIGFSQETKVKEYSHTEFFKMIAAEKDSVFTLEPMSFKNSETNTFHKGWITHYKNLGIAIPEGKLGCNPNGMANSNALKFIKKI